MYPYNVLLSGNAAKQTLFTVHLENVEKSQSYYFLHSVSFQEGVPLVNISHIWPLELLLVGCIT